MSLVGGMQWIICGLSILFPVISEKAPAFIRDPETHESPVLTGSRRSAALRPG